MEYIAEKTVSATPTFKTFRTILKGTVHGLHR